MVVRYLTVFEGSVFKLLIYIYVIRDRCIQKHKKNLTFADGEKRPLKALYAMVSILCTWLILCRLDTKGELVSSCIALDRLVSPWIVLASFLA